MATGRSFFSVSPSTPLQFHGRSFQGQESPQEMDLQAEGHPFPFYPSPNQNYLPSFFQGSFHNPEGDHMKQMSPLMPTSPQIESKGILANRLEQASYSPEVKPAVSGPPKHGIGNLTSVLGDQAKAQELLIDNNKQEPGEWVTVFGFPPAATSMILTHFSECGSIEEKKSIPGSNWIHLKYATKIESRRALSKNGTILNSTLMIGVVPYNSDGGHPSSTRIRYLGQQNVEVNPQIPNTYTTFNASLPTESQPGIINKTFEYLFGW